MLKDKIPQNIGGLHFGIEGSAGVGFEVYGYIQGDILFDWSSGTIYGLYTYGNGGSWGVPNGISVQGYGGLSSVHNIPLSANTQETLNLLSGDNIDMSSEFGGDAFAEIFGTKGLSIDLDPRTGRPQKTTAGWMYSLETSVGVGVGMLPTVLSGNVEGGWSRSEARMLLQVPWWPKPLWWLNVE